MTDNDQTIICDLTVLSAPARQQMAATIPETFKQVTLVQELCNGYAFQFPNEPGMFMALATFIEHERQCCPFYHFALESEPNSGPFWLRMTGDEGIKEFVQAVWADFPAAIANQQVHIESKNEFADAITQAAPILAETIEKAEQKRL